MDFWGHLKTVNHHRALVRKYCFRLGLYWQGLTHDLSKYSPVEFWTGVKYFQGDHSPNDAQRKARGYSASWMHHKGRNRHHFEFWTDYGPEGIQGVEMPAKYVAEMFCDRLAASKVYRGTDFDPGDPYRFFLRGRNKRLLLHRPYIHTFQRVQLLCRHNLLPNLSKNSYQRHGMYRRGTPG